MSRTTSLTVTLPDDLDAFIRERVAAGRFPSAGALIRQAVEDLERRERERDAVIADLNREWLTTSSPTRLPTTCSASTTTPC